MDKMYFMDRTFCMGSQVSRGKNLNVTLSILHNSHTFGVPMEPVVIITQSHKMNAVDEKHIQVDGSGSNFKQTYHR